MLGLLGNVGGGAYNYGSFRGVGGFPYDSPINPHFFRMGLTLPSPQDLPLPIKSLGLSSSEQEEGKKKEGKGTSQPAAVMKPQGETSSAEAQGTKGQEAQWPRVS